MASGLGLLGWSAPAAAAPGDIEDEFEETEVAEPTADDAPTDDAPTDDEAAPAAAPSGGEASARGSVSIGGGADGEAKGKRGRRPKRAKKERERCHSKPFDILDCVPGNHTLEIGMHVGAFILAKNHGLFKAGLAPQPSIRRANADIGWRILYLPIPYVGIGFEGTVMPTRSPSESADATMYSIRGHVAGQAPWRITPTFVMGGGLLGIRSGRELLNSAGGFFYYGPGGKFYINDWIAVRVEGRHLVSPDGNNGKRAHHGEIFAALDLTLPIGRWVERANRRKNKDRDGDGYPDADDACPDQYAEDARGCPENLDSDHDGVLDARDHCPQEWGDGASGCPTPDADGDGVLDSVDSCIDEPETHNGYEDTDGCPDEEPAEVKAISGVIEGIFFDSGSANVLPKSRLVLDQAVETLIKFPKIRLKITGHTDDTGKRETNTRLSAARAQGVKNYLTRKGVAESRLETAGVGPDMPIADNDTKEGRAKNRRIEFERLADAPE